MKQAKKNLLKVLNPLLLDDNDSTPNEDKIYFNPVMEEGAKKYKKKSKRKYKKTKRKSKRNLKRNLKRN